MARMLRSKMSLRNKYVYSKNRKVKGQICNTRQYRQMLQCTYQIMLLKKNHRILLRKLSKKNLSHIEGAWV